MNKGKRIGLGKLSDFGRTGHSPPSPELTPTIKEPDSHKGIRGLDDEAVSVNIKIGSSQREWLDRTARKIRGNNDVPVKPGDRVYPQHLIGIAIELLQCTDIDWSTIQSIEDLREYLNL